MSLAFAASERRPRKLPPVCQLSPRRDFGALNRARKDAGISVNRLLSAADISHHTWDAARNGKSATRDSTFDRLWAALDRLRRDGTAARPPAAIKALVLAAEEILRARIRGRLIVACNPQRMTRDHGQYRLPASRLRTLAIYLVAVELEIENVAIAMALGCSRQNVKKARETVETLRDNEAVDALFTRCGKLLTGAA